MLRRAMVRRGMSELYHEPTCWITNVFTFPALPALLILVLARLAAAVPAIRPGRIEPGGNDGSEGCPVAVVPTGPRAAGVESFFVGRGDAWPDPSWLRLDGCDPFRAVRRRWGRGSSG